MPFDLRFPFADLYVAAGIIGISRNRCGDKSIARWTLFSLIECWIAARTKRPSGPTGRTCYQARQIDTRQRTHSPYLFRLRAGLRLTCLPVGTAYSRITSRRLDVPPVGTVRVAENGREREKQTQRVQRSSPFNRVNVTRVKLFYKTFLGLSANFGTSSYH